MPNHTLESFDTTQGRVTLSLDAGDKSVYPLEVVYGAAYVFIDRAFVLLDRDGDMGTGRILVHLRSKKAATEAELLAMSGEFGNELLSQALRRMVVKQNQKLIEEITTQAIAGAAGGTLPQDFLQAGDDGLDFLDDPLGIAVPWEEKFKKSGKDKTDGAAGETP